MSSELQLGRRKLDNLKNEDVTDSLGGVVCRFHANLEAYQNLITQSLYDKQLDSGRGTLLHLCDDVIQQEV